MFFIIDIYTIQTKSNAFLRDFYAILYANQNHILSKKFLGLRTVHVGSSMSISALPDHKSISSNLTNFDFLMNLYPKKRHKKIGMSIYGGINDFSLNFPGKKASNPLKNAIIRQKQMEK